MKNKLAVLVLLLTSHFTFVTIGFSDEVKIKQILDTERVYTCITQDKDGLLLIGTVDAGLYCYNGKEMKSVQLGIEKSFQVISSIFTDNDGIIWFFIQNYGLHSYDKKTGLFKNYKCCIEESNSLTSCSVNWLPNIIAQDKEGLIWIGTKNGLNSFDKTTGKFTQYKHVDNSNSLSNNNIWTICVDREGSIWVGTENTGIDKFDKKTKTFVNYGYQPNKSNCLSYNEVHNLMVDRFNNLWINNENRPEIDRYDIKTGIFYHYNYDPKDNHSKNTLCIFEDNAGIIWLIDALGGISKCIWWNSIFTNYAYNPENPSTISVDDLINLYEDKKHNIWIGTFNGGLCLYAGDDKFQVFKSKTSNEISLPSNSVFSVLDATENKLWLGIYGGIVTLFDVNKKQVIKNFKNLYSQDTPCTLIADNKYPNMLWFSSFFTSGLYRLDTTTGIFTQYKYDSNNISSISNKNTISMLQDGDILWIATGGDGLCKFDKTTGKCEYYKHDPNDKNSISGNVVIEPFIDSKGSFWVTTDDGGLNKFDRQTGSFTSYGMECGFPSKSTRHILEDNGGYLWISTDSGIVKFNPVAFKVVNRFTTADGLPSNHFDKLTNALKDYKGNFWFSTLKGLCKFNPEEASKIEPNKHIPSIVLSSFKSKEGTKGLS